MKNHVRYIKSIWVLLVKYYGKIISICEQIKFLQGSKEPVFTT